MTLTARLFLYQFLPTTRKPPGTMKMKMKSAPCIRPSHIFRSPQTGWNSRLIVTAEMQSLFLTGKQIRIYSTVLISISRWYGRTAPATMTRNISLKNILIRIVLWKNTMPTIYYTCSSSTAVFLIMQTPVPLRLFPFTAKNTVRNSSIFLYGLMTLT